MRRKNGICFLLSDDALDCDKLNETRNIEYGQGEETSEGEWHVYISIEINDIADVLASFAIHISHNFFASKSDYSKHFFQVYYR